MGTVPCDSSRSPERNIKRMTKEDVSLMAILADVDEVLVRHSADTAQVAAAGQQLIYTAFGTRLRLSESRRKPRFQYAEREQARP